MRAGSASQTIWPLLGKRLCIRTMILIKYGKIIFLNIWIKIQNKKMNILSWDLIHRKHHRFLVFLTMVLCPSHAWEEFAGQERSSETSGSDVHRTPSVIVCQTHDWKVVCDALYGDFMGWNYLHIGKIGLNTISLYISIVNLLMLPWAESGKPRKPVRWASIISQNSSTSVFLHQSPKDRYD